MYVSGVVWRPGMVFIQFITAEVFRYRRWFLSSCTQQKFWWTHQRTEQCHMPLPN